MTAADAVAAVEVDVVVVDAEVAVAEEEGEEVVEAEVGCRSVWAAAVVEIRKPPSIKNFIN